MYSFFRNNEYLKFETCMENPTSIKVGRLYALFLEVSKDIVCFILHEEFQVPRGGDRMYKRLVSLLAGGDNTFYRRKIMNNPTLSEKQKRYLAPPNQIIDEATLDFSLCVKIMRLLGIEKKVIPFMIEKRNFLCHYSVALLEQNMTEEEFVFVWYEITIQLEKYGFDRIILDKFWRVINN